MIIYSAGALALLGWLLVGCAVGRPTSLIRMRGDYELLGRIARPGQSLVCLFG